MNTTATTISAITTLCGELNAYHRFRELSKKKQAMDFNPLTLFPIGEVINSRLLAFFLDPKATHGQGSTFLKIFTDSQDWGEDFDTFSLDNALVECEVHTHENRYLDLLIRWKNHCIIVENKLYATDQPKQLEDYINYAQEYLKLKWRCVYLTMEGSNPGEHSLSAENAEKYTDQKRLKCISHKQEIHKLLIKFEKACDADNVRMFIRNIIKYYETNYMKETSMEEEQIISDALKSNIHLFKVADSIAAIKSELKSQIIHRYGECFAKCLTNKNNQDHSPKWEKDTSNMTLNEMERYPLKAKNGTEFNAIIEFGCGGQLYIGLIGDENYLLEKERINWKKIEHQLKEKGYKLWDKNVSPWSLAITVNNGLDDDTLYELANYNEEQMDIRCKNDAKKFRTFYADLAQLWHEYHI